ncbi:MAG: Stk1 family PASTA domain-containing Ser/Thr kinase [Bifidobacteriaceae bacterium]|nr:Stk1 family PASTA domain-containing Ser/Thr kinase [Bifidobacteriaceae bacterium]
MAKPVHDPLIGVTIDGRYRITARIARGGMATVYRANDLRLDREVALKVLHPHLAEGQEFIDRFRREARAAARLIHPGIVGVYDQGTWGESPYLVMELVDGPNLRTVLGRAGLPPVGKALDLMAGVLDALGVAHSAGFVHRDIKPENILVSGGGQVKVADFGLARAVSEVTAASSGVVLGTVAYLSPELVAEGTADARTDVYAAGVVLFELLTGSQPFTGEAPIQVAFLHVHGDFPKPSSRVDWLPPEIDQLVATLTAKDPADRPEDAVAAQRLVKAARQALPAEIAKRAAALPPDAVLDDEFSSTGAARPRGRHAAETGPKGASEEVLAPTSALAPGAQLPDDGATDPLTGTGGTRVGQRNRTGGTRALPLAVIPPPKPDTGQGPVAPTGRPRTATSRVPVAPVKKRSHWVRNFLIALFIIALLAAGAVAGWYYLAGPGAKVAIPRLVGLTQQQAEADLAPLELTATITSVYSDTTPAGEVMEADPPLGTKVAKDSTVALVVSKGIEHKVIPNSGIVGVDQTTAEKAIAAAGLDGEITYVHQWNGRIPAGQVISMEPDGGETVPHNEPITLTVSDGPEPVEVPDLTNLTVDDARRSAAPFDLSVAEGDSEPSTTVAEGLIIRQDPEAGSDSFRGETITVVVSTGLPYVEVPEVQMLSYEDAAQKLEDVGLVPEKNAPVGVILNLVQRSSPSAGEYVRMGTTVVLTVF